MLRAALYGRFSSDNQREESIMPSSAMAWNIAKRRIIVSSQSMPTKRSLGPPLSVVTGIIKCSTTPAVACSM